MDDTAGAQLRWIVGEYGRRVAEDPRRVEALLRDLAGTHRREIAVLVGAAREGVPAELQAGGGTVPAGVLGERLARALQDNLGLGDEAARWAVATWAMALGIEGFTATTPTLTPTSAPSLQDGPALAASPPTADVPEAAVLVVAPLGAAHHRTISAAIIAADPGTRVVVRPGTYRETVVIDKPLELLADQSAGEVVIEAADGDCVAVRTDHAVVRGFTLRNRAAGKSKKHYGVNITQGFVLLEDCDITSDSLACIAIHGADASPEIRKCRVHDGAQTGVLFRQHARGLVEDCDIWGNGLSAVEISEGADPVLRGCTFRQGRSVGVHVHGGGLGTVERCDIWGNERSGVLINSGGNLAVRACRIHDGRRAGIVAQHEGRGTVEDCAIWANALSGIEICERGELAVRACKIHDGLEHGILVNTGGHGTVEDCELAGNASTAILVEVSGGPVEIRGCRVEESQTALDRTRSAPRAGPLEPAQLTQRVARLRADAEETARAVKGTGTTLQVRRSVTDRIDGVARAESTTAQASALALVAVALADADPERAERLAREISDETGRAQALANLAHALAPGDPNRAERLARSISAKSQHAWAVCQVAVAVADTDPDRAERLARSVTGPREQAWVLARLVEALAGASPDRAERIAQSIADTQARVTALCQVADVLARTAPRRSVRLLRDTERLARSIPDKRIMAKSLADVAAALAVPDPERSERVARSIQTLMLST